MEIIRPEIKMMNHHTTNTVQQNISLCNKRLNGSQ